MEPEEELLEELELLLEELLLEEELLELLLEEDEELLLDELELLPVSIVVPQFSTIPLMKRPVSVRSASLQLPYGLAPGRKIDEPSSLSLTAQLRWEMLFCFRKFIQLLVSP